MESETISIAFANEICRYGEDIQREVYEQHLKNENGYGCWRGMKASDVARAIEQNYTTDLEKYDLTRAYARYAPTTPIIFSFSVRVDAVNAPTASALMTR